MKNKFVIKDLTTPELLEKIEEDKVQLKKLSMSHVVTPLENPMKIRSYRRSIAVLKTELRRRELEVKNK